jgi:hypothetical protein
MKNAFVMFGAQDHIPVECVELLILGIENLYDNKEYLFDVGNNKTLDISDSLKFFKFHKRLQPWVDLKLHLEHSQRQNRKAALKLEF